MSVRTSFHVIYGVKHQPTRLEGQRFFNYLDENNLWEKAKQLYVADMDANNIYFGHSFFHSGTDYDGFDGDWYQNIDINSTYLNNIEENYIKKFKEILPVFSDWIEYQEFSLHALIACH